MLKIINEGFNKCENVIFLDVYTEFYEEIMSLKLFYVLL